MEDDNNEDCPMDDGVEEDDDDEGNPVKGLIGVMLRNALVEDEEGFEKFTPEVDPVLIVPFIPPPKLVALPSPDIGNAVDPKEEEVASSKFVLVVGNKEVCCEPVES